MPQKSYERLKCRQILYNRPTRRICQVLASRWQTPPKWPFWASRDPFLPATFLLCAMIAIIACLCVCLCVTRRYCIKTAKRRITHTTPRDSPGTLVFWRKNSLVDDTRSNRGVGPFPDNNHEEADTLMICLGVSATERNSVDAQMTFFSPDTNVLVLITANYGRLPKNTSISMASSVQQIKPLWTALGPDSMHFLGETTLDGLLG